MNPFALPFARNALIAGLLAGSALSWIGLFIQARRLTFSGLAASQLAAFGAVACLVAGVHWGGFGAALLFVALGSWVLAGLARLREVPEESWSAWLYASAAAAAVLVLAKAPGGEAHSMSVFFGNLLAVGDFELRETAALFLATAAVLGPWLRRWIWLSMDPLSARVSGMRTRAWDAAFLGLFAAAMTVSIDIFGVLLSFSYLVLPSAAALLLGLGLRGLLLTAPAVACAATALGAWLSFVWDLPTGPLVALLLGAAVGLCVAWRLARR